MTRALSIAEACCSSRQLPPRLSCRSRAPRCHASSMQCRRSLGAPSSSPRSRECADASFTMPQNISLPARRRASLPRDAHAMRKIYMMPPPCRSACAYATPCHLMTSLSPGFESRWVSWLLLSMAFWPRRYATARAPTLTLMFRFRPRYYIARRLLFSFRHGRLLSLAARVISHFRQAHAFLLAMHRFLSQD